jgi:outer membrane protein assembly factor BamB
MPIVNDLRLRKTQPNQVTLILIIFPMRSFRLEFLLILLGFIQFAGGFVGANAEEPERVQDGLKVNANDWPWWRGPSRNGTAHSPQTPPVQWSESSNVIWKAPIEGRGYGSPTIFGDRILLAASDESSGSQSLVCLDRATGKKRWQTMVHESGGMMKNAKSTAASGTPACDGTRVYIAFPNSDQLVTTALDLDGKIVWQQSVSKYVEHQGYGASPALYQKLVIVSADNKGGGAIAALDGATGKVVWTRERPAKPNYCSPTLVRVGGKDQVILIGCDLVTSYHPMTGETLWETEGATTECVTSTVTHGELIYTSGGYPRNHMSAFRADGSKELVWENGTRLYVPSMVIHDGYLYGALDEGIAMCWDAATGEEQWKKRLGGTFSSSLVLAGKMIYATNEEGDTFVFAADPEAYQQLGKNKLGHEVFATPVICDGRIYHRVTESGSDGQRQEMLYCLGQTE